MKKILSTIAATFLMVNVANSQTVISDTLIRSLGSLEFSSSNATHDSVSVDTTSQVGYYVYTPAPTQMTASTYTATLSTDIDMTQIDSIQIIYKFSSNGGTLNGNPGTNGPTINTFQSNGNVVLNLFFGTSAFLDHIYIAKKFYVISYSHQTTTGIKSLNDYGLNVFTYENNIKTIGSIPNDFKFEVVNLSGQSVLKGELQNEISTNLPIGIYVLRVFNHMGNLVENKKVVLSNK